eukprot:NODE_18102_length_910_cov_4.744572.p1 GENE.NODE_18102_length_910_cov_4.744572~~NODE_18102_length_910_cov_4.744572.p1  ORF type:complete len:198 (+),score=41.85 NODE_18102_length_910_cov_4.744572:244-837(+)
MGYCTAVLHARAASVLALDVSEKQLAEGRSRLPNVHFEFLDIFEEAARLREMPESARCTAALLDIGGDRHIAHVMRATALLLDECLPRLRLLLVKSEQLYAAMVAWGCLPSVGGEGALVTQPCFLASMQCLQKPAPACCMEQAASLDSSLAPAAVAGQHAGSKQQWRKKERRARRGHAEGPTDRWESATELEEQVTA